MYQVSGVVRGFFILPVNIRYKYLGFFHFMLLWRMLIFPVTVMIHNNFCLEIYNNAKTIQSVYTVVINTQFP